MFSIWILKSDSCLEYPLHTQKDQRAQYQLKSSVARVMESSLPSDPWVGVGISMLYSRRGAIFSKTSVSIQLAFRVDVRRLIRICSGGLDLVSL